MQTLVPFTYLVGWSKQQKFYYGVRYANNCHPNQLWTVYYTSSNYVKRFREIYGEPDIIQVRKTFRTKEDAIKWEHTVLKRLNVLKEDKWLNMAVGSKNRTDGPLTEIHKEHLSNSLRQYNHQIPKEKRTERSSKAASLLWEKFSNDTTFAETLREKRRLQINPMQGKKQKRTVCPSCNKEFSVNNFAKHIKKGCP